VWEKVDKGGPYSASNTLMIGDKPYKAYLNPVISKLIFIFFYNICFFIYSNFNINLNYRRIQEFLSSHMILMTRRTMHWVRKYASYVFI
jgi:hypothetical protein